MVFKFLSSELEEECVVNRSYVLYEMYTNILYKDRTLVTVYTVQHRANSKHFFSTIEKGGQSSMLVKHDMDIN
jgi:hypothetical protein